jgi:hypothetical protein
MHKYNHTHLTPNTNTNTQQHSRTAQWTNQKRVFICITQAGHLEASRVHDGKQHVHRESRRSLALISRSAFYLHSFRVSCLIRAKKKTLFRPTSANDAFDKALWETFVSTTLGLEVPILTALPRLHTSPLAKCGCKKFCMDFHGDHTSTCHFTTGWCPYWGRCSARPDTRYALTMA